MTRSPAIPARHNAGDAMMLWAVAAASPNTTLDPLYEQLTGRASNDDDQVENPAKACIDLRRNFSGSICQHNVYALRRSWCGCSIFCTECQRRRVVYRRMDRYMSALRLRLAALSIVVALAGSAPAALAQSTPAGREVTAASVANYSVSQQMPVDPEVLVGTLPNGLRYYVRANGKPAHQAELRLVVRTGSVLEDDDQPGVAHFVEHMEFEAPRIFPSRASFSFYRRSD